MDRRRFLRTSVAFALAGASCPLLPGCGGHDNTAAAPDSIEYLTVSMDLEDQYVQLLTTAKQTGAVPPDLLTILRALDGIFTPEQIAYVKSLDLHTGAEAEVRAKADAYSQSLISHVNGVPVITLPPIFANDLDRIQMELRKLPLLGGLPVYGAARTITQDAAGNVVVHEPSGASSGALSLSGRISGAALLSANPSSALPLQSGGLCFDQPRYDRFASAINTLYAVAVAACAAAFTICLVAIGYLATNFITAPFFLVAAAKCLATFTVCLSLQTAARNSALEAARLASFKPCHDQGSGG